MESLTWIEESDFAPGDRSARQSDWSGFQCHRIQSASDPHFQTAFDLLWEQFHPAGEMETRETLESRFARRASPGGGDFNALYEMVLVYEHDRPAAVRDFTLITSARFRHLSVLVHLSHNLVLPPWRRSGLAGWMRALPMAVARLAHLAPDAPRPDGRIALAGEMEAPNPAIEATMVRLKAYGKAGFRKIDPARVPFLQPDFRAPELIAQDEERPLPLQLVVRFRPEPERSVIDGATIREIVGGLYDMYALEFRPEFMRRVRASLDAYPPDAEEIALLDPVSS